MLTNKMPPQQIRSLRQRFSPILWLVIIAIVVCLILGFWQWHRYQFKKTLLHHFQQQQLQLPTNINQLTSWATLQTYQQIIVQGRFEPTVILLENQMRHGQVGVDVIKPFRCQTMMHNQSSIIYVDLGWVSLSALNKMLPQLQHSYDEIIKGYIVIPKGYSFILGPEILNWGEQPLRIQRISKTALCHISSNKEPCSFYIRATSPDKSFVRDWVIVSVSPWRHLGYACQWYLFALTGIVVLIKLVRIKGKDHEK
jgi:surfeit locus 1 family protein